MGNKPDPDDKKSTSNQKNRMAKNEFYQKWNREREKPRDSKQV